MLTSAYYVGGDAFQQEKRTVFAASWLPIGVTPQLAQSGSFVSATIGGWPVFAVRGADGEIRAFRNTCRHKGMMVVEQPTGRCETLRCRYHGWTYGLDGRFQEAPTPVAPRDPASPTHDLTPLDAECRHEIVFVSLAPGSAAGDYSTLDSAVAARDGVLGAYVASITSEIGCNWKTFLEHALTDQTTAWQWPLVLMRSDSGTTVVEQVVPRSFLRTRTVTHIFVSDDDLREAAIARENARAGEVKSACEALQTARAEGKAAALDEPRTAALHARLSEAYRLYETGSGHGG